MLYIITERHPVTGLTSASGNKFTTEWHIGQLEPIYAGKVITFQADGDELMLIIEAIKKASCAYAV